MELLCGYRGLWTRRKERDACLTIRTRPLPQQGDVVASTVKRTEVTVKDFCVGISAVPHRSQETCVTSSSHASAKINA